MRLRTLLVLCAALVVLVPVALGGGSPSIAWSPSGIYGTVTVGQTASKTFTLTNSGGSATGMLSVSISGSGSSVFSITSDACTGTALGKKKSCAVTVQFAPTTAGQNYSATLTASGKKPVASASITLTGTGQLPTGVPNPSFTDDCSGVPCHWNTDVGFYTISRDTLNFHSSPASLAVLGTSNGSAPQGLSDCFAVSPSTTYDISGWYSTTSSGLFDVELGISEYSGATCAPFVVNDILQEFSPMTTGAWTFLQGQATTNPATHSARFFARFRCGGTCEGLAVNFDDVDVSPVP